MPYTQQDLDNIRAAIATGAKRVEYADKVLENRTLAELQEIERIIAAELGQAPQKPKTRRLAVYNKGIYPPEKFGK